MARGWHRSTTQFGGGNFNWGHSDIDYDGEPAGQWSLPPNLVPDGFGGFQPRF
jgi:hypothetical protein